MVDEESFLSQYRCHTNGRLYDVTENDSELFHTGDIQFLSDRLSFGMLRRAHPEMFDSNLVFVGNDPRRYQYQGPAFLNHSPENLRDSLNSLFWTERLVAACAYADLAGVDRPEIPAFSLDELKAELANQYVRYGLALGSGEARESIRDIERQVRAQFKGVRRW